MKSVLLIVFLLTSGWALAEQDSRLVQLAAAYDRLQLEQQAAYQQFQMTQELRRNELQDSAPITLQNYSVMGQDSMRSLDYDENIRKQRERQERLQRYDREISQAYSRFMELGYRKKALLDQIMELTQPAQR